MKCAVCSCPARFANARGQIQKEHDRAQVTHVASSLNSARRPHTQSSCNFVGMHASIKHRTSCAHVCTTQRRRGNRAKCVVAAAERPALLYDFHGQLIPYDQAWAWQKQRVSELCDAATADRRDTVFILQHLPVYTLGAGSSESHVKFDLQNPPHPLYRTERGGEVTYHGPGQLVVYPILDLNHHTRDLHWYLRGLEEVIIRALADTSGLQGRRIEGLTGVWVNGYKLAAIGVRARKWVTYHGLALNVSTVLQPFGMITPCGISDRPVGSVTSALAAAGQAADVSLDNALMLHEELLQQKHLCNSASTNTGGGSSSGSSRQGRGAERHQQQQQPPMQQQWWHTRSELHKDLVSVSADPLIVEYRYALLEALEDVFGLQLQHATQQQMQQLLQQSSSGDLDASIISAAV